MRSKVWTDPLTWLETLVFLGFTLWWMRGTNINTFIYPLSLLSEQYREHVRHGYIQWSGRFLNVTGWNPSVCKSNRSYVHIIRFSFIKLGYILHIPLKWSVIFLQSRTSSGEFSNSTGSFVTNCRFSPIIGYIRGKVFFRGPVGFPCVHLFGNSICPNSMPESHTWYPRCHP